MRMRVSDIDSYKYYMEHEEKTYEEFISELRREATPRPQMFAGTALHEALEQSAWGDTITHAGGTVCPVVDLGGIDVTLPIPTHGIVEMDARKTYETSVGTVDLRGRVDLVAGDHIYDYKLTSSPDVEKYIEAAQWRAYIDMLDAYAMTYYIFGYSKRVDHDSSWGEKYYVTSFAEHTFYRYPTMVDELRQDIDEFARFYQEHVVQPYTQKQGAALKQILYALESGRVNINDIDRNVLESVHRVLSRVPRGTLPFSA